MKFFIDSIMSKLTQEKGVLVFEETFPKADNNGSFL